MSDMDIIHDSNIRHRSSNRLLLGKEQKMTREEAIEVIRKEYACVDADCDIERSCGKCELHMPSKEPILKAYEMAIQALSQEPTSEKELNKAYTFGHKKGVKVYWNEQTDTVELPEAVFRYILSLVPSEKESAK